MKPDITVICPISFINGEITRDPSMNQMLLLPYISHSLDMYKCPFVDQFGEYEYHKAINDNLRVRRYIINSFIANNCVEIIKVHMLKYLSTNFSGSLTYPENILFRYFDLRRIEKFKNDILDLHLHLDYNKDAYELGYLLTNHMNYIYSMVVNLFEELIAYIIELKLIFQMDEFYDFLIRSCFGDNVAIADNITPDKKYAFISSIMREMAEVELREIKNELDLIKNSVGNMIINSDVSCARSSEELAKALKANLFIETIKEEN